MEPTQRPPQTQQPAHLPIVPEGIKSNLPACCVLGRQVPVLWLRASSTVVQVERLN
jgi:hypothetical protein